MACYMVNAKYTPAGLRKLATRSILELRKDLDRAARSLDGRIVDFFLVSGDFRIIVLFDFQRGANAPSLSSLIFSILSSDVFEPGAVLGRLETPEVIDEELA